MLTLASGDDPTVCITQLLVYNTGLLYIIGNRHIYNCKCADADQVLIF